MVVDFWYEIYESIKRNPSRAIISGIGIAWGIFVLILLVGVGAGFEKGVYKLFSGFTKSTTYLHSQTTSIIYNGEPIGRKISFTSTDLQLLSQRIPEINHISPELNHWSDVSFAGRKEWFEIKGVYPDYFNIKKLKAEEGRVLNPHDAMENRKVALIGQNVSNILFRKENPIGKSIQLNNEFYKVVGIIKNSILNSFEERAIYIPYSSYSLSDQNAKQFTTVLYSLRENTDAKKIQFRIKTFMSQIYHFDPNDDKVFYFNSMEEQVKAFNTLFATLRKFLWFMGISTLVGGVIGIANIMYSSAKERTREIGIRKAVGANPNDVKAMIMWESIALTSIAGYLGIVLGYGALAIIGRLIPEDNLMMGKPEINILSTFLAVIILIFSGTLAGLKPAIYAAYLNPIDALRDEN